eukprot:SAG31_NODE_1408_length_8473_cov_2.276809_6_plen_62_part_00
MERRVQRVLAGEDVLARDPSMRQGSCAGLWRAIELVEGVRVLCCPARRCAVNCVLYKPITT